MGIEQVDGDVRSAQRLLMQPWWLDWTAGLFPVILIVFLLRSFLFEPFKIPSGSMIPDAAGGRPDPGQQVPLWRAAAGDQQEDRRQQRPQRGDVMVFRYPVDPRLDYIKRVVGVPGDEVAYLNQKLTHQRQAGAHQRRRATTTTTTACAMRRSSTESSASRRAPHPGRPKRQATTAPIPRASLSENCRYSAEGVSARCRRGTTS
jgi:signal peptidase I